MSLIAVKVMGKTSSSLMISTKSGGKKMGGIGSGKRWHYGAKDTTEDYMPIDIRRWQREGLLTPGTAFT
jgi:hypothetical protein